jgi:hypothetical protein
MTPTPLDNPADKLAGIVSQLYEIAANSTVPTDQRQSLLLKAHDLRGDLVALVATQFTEKTDAYTQTMASLSKTIDALNQAEANIQKVIDVVNNVGQLAASIDALLQEAAKIAAAA